LVAGEVFRYVDLSVRLELLYGPILKGEVIEEMKAERKVAIYARVSTNSGRSPEMQIGVADAHRCRFEGLGFLEVRQVNIAFAGSTGNVFFVGNWIRVIWRTN
jgi:hypothetical protein